MFAFEFKTKASKEVEKLPQEIRQRILEKLKFYAKQEHPLRFADKIKDYRFGDYRFRMGDYRIIFDVDGKKIVILKVGHRKDVYK